MRRLNVYLHNALIGNLTKLVGGQSLFTFEEEYINQAKRPVLSQSFLSQSGDLLLEPKIYRTKLPPFFSNLLPEGPLRKYLAEIGGVTPSMEFSLIQVLGEDLPGAITIRPAEGEVVLEKAEALKVEIKERQEAFHFSLAGVQLKFSALLDPKGGLTIPAHGVGGDWIIKLPSFVFEKVPQNEWAMMDLAQKVGINVPQSQLINISTIAHLPNLGSFKEAKVLAVKRFDRIGKDIKVHMEDFAQVYGVYPEDKYTKVSFTNITKMIWTLTGEKGLIEFIRRLVFTIMTGNGDMHLKNWSLLYPDGMNPELSPAYDLVSTIPYLKMDTLALKLAGTKEMQDCGEDLFKKLSIKAGVPKYIVMLAAKETAQTTIEIWNKEKKHYDLPKEMIQIITQHMEKIPLLKT